MIGSMYNELIFVFSYNREEMLKNVISHIKDYNYLIIDDGSDFTIKDQRFLKFLHHGREHWYMLWDYVLRLVEQTKHELIIFMHDDYQNIEIKRIFELHDKFKSKPYFYNINRDKRTNCWGRYPSVQIDDYTIKMGFIDCGFFCNRMALEKMGFYMIPVPQERFKNKYISSGVGQQMTGRIRAKNMDMYKPVRSISTHPSGDSKMLPEERKRHPFPSIN